MKLPTTSLAHRQRPLADTGAQRELLASREESFSQRAYECTGNPMFAGTVEILQMNLGKLCNMTCRHCHVDAGPDRREIMSDDTVDACRKLIQESPSIHTVDLTGGAPEMHARFCELVEFAHGEQRHVIDRCNLTILLAPGYRHLPEFLASNQVEVVASLPCYLEENTDAQRGDGAFQSSVDALRTLNRCGYGVAESGLTLSLVYNPVGTSLPPPQPDLEAAYRAHLEQQYGIRFTRLFTITNMPISRYLECLVEEGDFESYFEKLVQGFNPATLAGLMCRSTLSVSWEGQLYDCDFNQMLDMPVAGGISVQDIELDTLAGREIQTANHCFGCAAGAGSSCQGAISNG